MIKKYPLGSSSILVFQKHKLLDAQYQGANRVIWFDETEDDKDLVEISFKIVLTGEKSPDGYNYFSTLQSDNGRFVEHIYYAKKK